ncbi:E3 ubiquitin-protein ligase rnf213-alpha-like [Watersipora subatra]|uniref:E3 ubiquitin-protein ligase rnf213-alpha-like n=1 Tax=Watersipora subatra TaxID=2589382 RepID=UPI00355BE1CC
MVRTFAHLIGEIGEVEQMRDAVENLASAYIEIRKEGCIQFDDLKVVVHCDQSHDVAIEIKLQAIEESLYGQSSESSSLEHCHDMYAYLTTCIRRCENLELNYYTTEQLIVLRKELGRLNSQGDTSCLDQAQALLAMIHPVTGEELLPLLADYDSMNTERVENGDGPSGKKYEELSQADQDLVEYMLSEVEYIPSRDVAVEVFNHIGAEMACDSEAVMDWLEKQKQVQQAAFENASNTEDVLSKVIKSSLMQKSLKESLDTLWHEFIADTSKSVKNFLGVPQLAYVLKNLKDMSGDVTVPRTLPAWLERGKPVLVAVPKEQTFQMVLTIYETDREFRSPTRNEVLICNKTTRQQEKMKFSFYCLVNCHLLKYDVCRIIENRLSNLADHEVDSYGLAFIYAEEARDARIKAYLDKQLVRNWQLHKNLVRRLRSMSDMPGKDVTICLHNFVNTDDIIARLTEEFPPSHSCQPSYDTIHLDIAHEVEHGVDELLFNLVILRSIVNSEGVVWQVKQEQYYIIECMPFTAENGCHGAGQTQPKSAHEVIDFFPTIQCITPQEAYKLYLTQPDASFIGFDREVLKDERWQLVLNHLNCKQNKHQDFSFPPNATVSNPKEAIILLLRNCGLLDPTWSELCHYVNFLSSQLTKVLESAFCGAAFKEELPGFKTFVINFMLKMAEDFATRSLKIAEETPGRNIHELASGEANDLLENLTMKKTWERSNYPYLFFNEDGESFTSLGFDARRGNRGYALFNTNTNEMFPHHSMSADLYQALQANQVPISENFDHLQRVKQLKKLRSIMAKNVVLRKAVAKKSTQMFSDTDDPDPNYVLTMDNAKKILAIHQRLRVNIPVIIMGETGCGKTKLIEFMCKLQVPTELKNKMKTMEILKIHGGTTEEDIIQRIRKSQDLAKTNQTIAEDYANHFDFKQRYKED